MEVTFFINWGLNSYQRTHRLDVVPRVGELVCWNVPKDLRGRVDRVVHYVEDNRVTVELEIPAHWLTDEAELRQLEVSWQRRT